MLETLEPNFAVRHRWLITADWLLEHISHPQVIIVDCRFSLADPMAGQQSYDTGHIPGAYYLDLNRDLSSPVQRHGGRHPLPQPQALAAKLSALGVCSVNPDPSSHSLAAPTLVVAYDDSRFAFAARLWWLLRYYGHDQVVVLDGGYGAWQAAGYPVTSALPEMPVAQPGQFIPRLRPDWTVDIETIRQATAPPTLSKTQPAQSPLPVTLPFALIDSRETERYRGEREPIDPIAGHIAGAVNAPWAEVTDASGFAQPLASQQQRWSQLLGQDAVEQDALEQDALEQNALGQTSAEQLDSAPVVYCGSGVTACVNLLSLAMIGKFARLYPGSWSDWCSYLV